MLYQRPASDHFYLINGFCDGTLSNRTSTQPHENFCKVNQVQTLMVFLLTVLRQCFWYCSRLIVLGLRAFSRNNYCLLWFGCCDFRICSVKSSIVIISFRVEGANRFAGRLFVCPYFVIARLSALLLGAGGGGATILVALPEHRISYDFGTSSRHFHNLISVFSWRSVDGRIQVFFMRQTNTLTRLRSFVSKHTEKAL